MSKAGVNASKTSVPRGLCIPALLELWAQEIPDAVAIAAPGRTPLTYGGLWRHLETVVHALRALGVGRHDRVAIVLPQGPEMATAFVAVAAYATSAPLNPAYRSSEFEFYLADLHAKALIIQLGTDSPARAVARARGIPIIELLPVLEAAAGIFTLAGVEYARPVHNGFGRPEDVALVLHTSGTTSRPKSVPLTHTNICTSARNIAATLVLTEGDRCLNVMPLFHIHGLIGGLLTSLAAGASVVCPPGFYAPQFFGWLDEFKPTWYTAVPSMHQAILKRASANRETLVGCPLRFIRSSSAPLPAKVMAELEDLFKVPVIEAYGMTEASHQIASNPLPPRQLKAGSVGVAAGSEIAIVDEQRKLLSAGHNGEILVRGENIARGYENYPEINRESFSDGWLRTGDLGYLDEDGYLFITGRLKEMINRGGEKISPREIDDVLMEHPAVAQAVTFAVPHPDLGEEVSAAIVLHKGASATERAIQEFAAARLADFKVPRRVLIVDEIPKSATGKLQRTTLAEKLGVKPPDEIDPDGEAKYTPPRTGVEEKLAEIWSQVLGVDRVGIDDNFFALGGDSILAAQIISRVREAMHVELSFLSFSETATIAGMAGRLDSSGPTVPALPCPARQSAAQDKNLPLSYAQERLWFLEQLDPGSSAYNRPTFFRLTGRLNLAAFEQSLNEIWRRHEILRTTFSSVDGHPFQCISPNRSLHLPLVDLRGFSETARAAGAERLAAEEAQHPFDLARGPLLRTVLLRLADEEHILLLTFHHIVFDGWSQGVLLRELTILYEAFSAGKPSPLPDLPMQYTDFATWQRQWLQGEVLAAHLAYWRKQLEGGPDLLALPTDRPRPAVQTFRGAKESLVLSPTLTKDLKALSRRAEVSLFMTLLSAFQILLWRYTGQDEISVGTFNANRTRIETEGLIGFFVNNLVLRTNLSGNPSFREMLSRVREVCLGAYAHRDLPFEKLLEELQPERSLSHSPLFQVMLVLQNTPKPPLKLPNLTIRPYPTGEGNRSNFDLTLELSEDADGLSGHLEYTTDLFDAATMSRMLGQFRTLLKAVVANPEQRLSSLSPTSDTVHDTPAREPPVPDTVEETSVRGLNLAQRRASLSPAKQAILAKRLRGEFPDSSENSHVPQPPEQNRLDLKPLFRGADRASAPLSFGQQRLWFLDQLEPGSSLYNIPTAIRLSGPINTGALEQTLGAIVARHESLRTTFVTLNGDPVQRVAESRPVEVAVIDLSAWPETERETETQRLLHQEAQRPFNLSSDLMLRAGLLRLGEEEHILLLTTHHIASDGWSMGILFQEIAALYPVFCSGKLSPLPALPIQYADFAVWQRQWLQGRLFEKQRAYWKHQLAHPAVLRLPADRPRPPVQSYRGKDQSLTLSKSLSISLQALSRSEGVSLFMTLLAAFQTLLHRYTGQDDVVVGSPIAGRTREETEGLIGLFINTLVLRSDLSGNPTFRELLRRIREVALDAYDNQDLPFEKLVEELQPERDPSRHPLFQIMFVLQNAPTEPMELPGLAVRPLVMDRVTAKFDISLSMADTEDGLRGSLVYNTDLFEAATIRGMADHFRILLEGIVANPGQRLSELPLLTGAERQKLLMQWNSTERDFPKDRCIHELFEEQAERTPEAVAVMLDGKQLTYDVLNRRADQLAHRLRALGVGPGVFVAICMERSLEMVAGLLGILKAGGAYVPLDPSYPKKRLALMLDDTWPRAIVSQRSLLEALPKHAAKIVCVDSEGGIFPHEKGESSVRRVTACDPAYVIYTSGSTGTPNGVEITHGALANFITAVSDTFALASHDRVLQFASIAFDTAAEEIFPCLTRGATLVLRTDSMIESVSLFLKKCRDWKITVLDLPTAYWHELTDKLTSEQLTLPEELRSVIIGGERALAERLAQWQKAAGDHVRLWNTYGPTEATVVSTLCELTAWDRNLAPARQPPIGRPIFNVRAYVLDRYLNPVPVGVYGELYIEGAGLALGYLNLPDLTAEKFIPHPFSHKAGARLYRTGDLARYLPDGNIEFLGRIDHQIKIRGFRIEPGEIETALRQHPAVRETVVSARTDSPGDPSTAFEVEKRLVAYVVPHQDLSPSTTELRGFLKEKLPDYMVPSAFVMLDSLPRTPNGKVDYGALPAPDQSRPGLKEAFAAPRTPEEKTIAEIWARVLKLEQVGVHDNFFELGGHSLLATQVISRLRNALSVALPLRSLFEGPTVAQLAESVTALRSIAEDMPHSHDRRIPARERGEV